MFRITRGKSGGVKYGKEEGRIGWVCHYSDFGADFANLILETFFERGCNNTREWLKEYNEVLINEPEKGFFSGFFCEKSGDDLHILYFGKIAIWQIISIAYMPEELDDIGTVSERSNEVKYIYDIKIVNENNNKKYLGTEEFFPLQKKISPIDTFGLCAMNEEVFIEITPENLSHNIIDLMERCLTESTAVVDNDIDILFKEKKRSDDPHVFSLLQVNSL